MSDMEFSHRKRPARRADELAAARFVEELSWLLTTYSYLDFRALRKLVVDRHEPRSRDLFRKFAPKNPNVVYLVGTLPTLFMNEALFPTNEEIAEFSLATLGIDIPRWQKKAKFELVGHIVCHAVSLEDRQVELLVNALTRVLENDNGTRRILSLRQEQGMNWNEVIQDLLFNNP